MREAINDIIIEGILSEVNLEYTTYTNKKTGMPTDAIRGEIIIRVEHEVAGEHRVEDVTVSCFAPKKTAKGGDNPSFQSWDSVKKNGVSIAACGDINQASRVAIRSGKNPNGKITMNEYYSQGGNLVKFPRITASFVNIINKENCAPKATGTVEMVVAKTFPELNKDGEETGRLILTGIVPKYGDKVEIIDFICESPSVISVVEDNWETGKTVRASVRLNFAQRVETVTKEVDFGEPIEESRTIRVSEVIIIGGKKEPLDDDMAFEYNDIQRAVTEHRAALEATKERKPKPAPAPTPAGQFNDLGF